MKCNFLYLAIAVFIVLACSEKKQADVTPWGSPLGIDSTATDRFSLSDIQNNGEMIMLTMSGPETYFDYHGKGMGTQYLLCEKFAHSIGVSLRVEVCKDTAEMLRRLSKGEADIIACQIPKTTRGLRFCGYGVDSLHTSWAVSSGSSELADSIDHWFKPSFVAQVKREENNLFSGGGIRRHVYAPMLNASRGEISRFDHLFKRYAPMARWDWRLMAAQCYQESTFDPDARSWAGACGLMQIMPSTASEVGLPHTHLFDPEQNIAAATRYINKLTMRFRDVRDRNERFWFVLASYNGGSFHVRDAMALASKYGKNPHRWSEVSEFILKLSDVRFYRDPVVKYGYMRGQETFGYVENIRARWNRYRGKASGNVGVQSFGNESFGPDDNTVPHRAKKRHRFRL